MIDPDNELRVRVENLREVAGRGLGFDLVVDSRLGASARWSEWQLGVQLYSISAEAESKVRLRLCCELELSLDFSNLPPDLLLEPTVADARLDVVDFRVHRLSKLDGPVIRKVGRSLRGVLQDEIERRRDKLTERTNREIDRHRDTLRVSPRDMVARGFGRLLRRFGERRDEGAS
jgi:hypothetical protein